MKKDEAKGKYVVGASEVEDSTNNANEMLSVPDTRYQIREETPHDYFCQIPNVADELDLTPYAYRLYGHLKRVAGESGKCWQSTKTLAKKCRMSTGAISEAKKELENTFPPLIRITSKTKENGTYHEIMITDIWQINHDFWTGESVHLVNTPPKRSPSERPRSLGETKKNPVTDNPKNVSLSEQEIKETLDKAGKMIESQMGRESSWQGRELIRADLLPFADWYNQTTNQVMTKRVQKSWWKALSEWKEEGLEIENLRAAFEAQSKWRMVSDPNMLTRDAVAFKAGVKGNSYSTSTERNPAGI